MNLYLDSSALVKRYLEEDGSDALAAAMDAAEEWLVSELTYVEVGRALALQGTPTDVGHFVDDWPTFNIVPLAHEISTRAVEHASDLGLRSLDAVQLASAERVLMPGDACATWDQRLAAACSAIGIRVLPSGQTER